MRTLTTDESATVSGARRGGYTPPQTCKPTPPNCSPATSNSSSMSYSSSTSSSYSYSYSSSSSVSYSYSFVWFTAPRFGIWF